jgi:3-dehydroquinate dehydratase-2
MKSILLINGPNLNLLGNRETSIYGKLSLEEINHELNQVAKEHQVGLQCLQSNSEAQIIEYIHHAVNQHDFIIINPAALAHTSIAIRDALLAVKIPFIEVHLSNIFAREAFRQHSFVSDIAVGTITGLGGRGYLYALNYVIEYLKNT